MIHKSKNESDQIANTKFVLDNLTSFKKTFNLSKLTSLCYNEAKNKGFHEEDEIPNISNYLMNLHGEVSELWEAYRKNKLNKPCDKSKTMKENNLKSLSCIEEELADVFIRVCDTAKAFKIDLAKAVFTKLLYNRLRPFRNGGKIA